MLCLSCIEKVICKLVPEDIIILEYLEKSGAIIPQCSIPREKIKKELDMTNYKCFTSLERLDCLTMVDKQTKTKSNKYYITDNGKRIINMIDKKICEV